MFKPEVIAFDVETALTDGTPSLEHYRHDFRVVSASFSWFDKDGNISSRFVLGELAVWKVLKKIQSDQIPLICHNFQFEYGVTRYRFPDIDQLGLIWHADTMRLTQVADNGGKAAQKAQDEMTLDEELEYLENGEPTKVSTGLGLQSAVSRFLPKEYHNHKEPFYEYLRSQGVKKGKEGENLHLLPPDMLRDYNVADTSVTLLLYKTLTDMFRDIGYDWGLDHQLYMSSARMIAESKGHGVRVDRKLLAANLKAVEAEITEIWEAFQTRFRNEIDALEQENLTAYVRGNKTEKGQTDRWLKAIENPEEYQFNLTSTKQKARLFIDLLGIEPKYFTKKGAPAFGKAFLKQYGEGGLMLQKRGTLMIALKQMQALYELSGYDGRWHVDLRAAGTTTGRFKGGQYG